MWWEFKGLNWFSFYVSVYSDFFLQWLWIVTTTVKQGGYKHNWFLYILSQDKNNNQAYSCCSWRLEVSPQGERWEFYSQSFGDISLESSLPTVGTAWVLKRHCILPAKSRLSLRWWAQVWLAPLLFKWVFSGLVEWTVLSWCNNYQGSVYSSQPVKCYNSAASKAASVLKIVPIGD